MIIYAKYIVFMKLNDSKCVEWKYVNYMKNIFQSIGLDHYYNVLWKFLIQTYLNIFSVKQFKIRNYLRDWK
jgi:hypothetical protein